MIQPALRSVESLDDPRTPSLAERLKNELPPGVKIRAAKAEHTVSSMAERFAPDVWRATRVTPERPLIRDAALSTPPSDARLFSTPTRGVLLVLTAVAIAPAAILAGLLWFGALRGPDPVHSEPSAAVAHQATLVPALPLVPPAAEIGLTAPEEIVSTAGDEVDFAIAIDTAAPLPARSAIAVRDLPDGAVFSHGRPFGAGEWSLRPDEIEGLTLRLPEDQTGASDLRVELVAADGAVLARTATRLDVAPPPTAGLVVRSGEADRVEDLMAHGHKMIDVGYFAGARAYYERAAEAGSGEAALAVGATYDPDFIAALGVQGIRPDRQAALTWYERAAALGLTDREAGLAALKQDWTRGAERTSVDDGEKPASEPRSAAREKEQPGPLGRLVAAATELATGEEWVEVSSAVNVRKGPSSDNETFKVAQKGIKLRVVARDGNWVHITDPATEQEGWIYTRFLKETDAP
jgi:SH3 domain-containing protein